MKQERIRPGAERGRRDPTALLSGALFVAFGLAFFLIGSDYSFGTARQMGAGYFPSVLAVLLMILGVFVVFFGHEDDEETKAPINFKGLILIPVAVVLFGLTVRGLGVMPAVFVSVLVCAFATPRFKWRPAVLLALALSVFCAAVFVKGLGIPLPILGPWLFV